MTQKMARNRSALHSVLVPGASNRQYGSWNPSYKHECGYNPVIQEAMALIQYKDVVLPEKDGDKTVVRSSYLHNGISYTGKMTSWYWIRAQGMNSMMYWIHVLPQNNIPEATAHWRFIVITFSVDCELWG